MQRRGRRNTRTVGGVRLSRREFITTTTLSLLALTQPHLARTAARLSAPRKIDAEALRKLAGKLRGHIITPGNAEYEAARQVWNTRFNRRPGAIVLCADADDAARAIEFARQRNIEAAIRSGGHSQAGFSTIDGGIVIDLSEMKRVDVDPAARLARAHPGITRVGFERATQRHGLVTAMGQCQDVGLGGLVLGGGEGALAGKYGTACDNVLEAEIVLADGRIVRASGSNNPDLLWGTCGGAGNLGVVTELSFQLYPLREAIAGWLWYPFAQVRDVMRAYRDFTRSTPDELTTELTVTRPQGRQLMVGIFVFHSDPARAERDLAGLHKLGRVALDSIKRRNYLDAQAAAGFPVVWGWSSYQRSGFAPQITDGMIDAISGLPPPLEADLWFAHLHGEISRKPWDFNAYHQRRTGFTFWAEANWQGAKPRDATLWVDRIWKVVRPATDGVYVNMLDVEPGREREAYGANYSRLAELKKKYDPDDFFRMNVNVNPV